jgi:dTMP kinase
MPDLTLILDLPVATARARRSGTQPQDRMELEPNHYHERVRSGFLEVARRFPERAVVLQADQAPDEVARECQRLAREVLASRRVG